MASDNSKLTNACDSKKSRTNLYVEGTAVCDS